MIRTDIRNQGKGGRNGQERRYVSGVRNDEQRVEATTTVRLDNSRKQLLTSGGSF